MSAQTLAPPSAGAGPGPDHPARRAILTAVRDGVGLPSPPAVVLEVVQAASDPDCRPDRIAALLARDPALCGKLLGAVNSALYGMSKPVGSVSRAVAVMGLNAVRSLALGLSLPALAGGGGPEMREFWMRSVGGAIIARELAVRARRPAPDDDLVAGLLRDLGELVIRRAVPDRWAAHAAGLAPGGDPCPAEFEAFGVAHAEVSAAVLRGWKLPEDLAAPVRHHHHPAAAPSGAARERADLLHLADRLIHLDAIAADPAAVDAVLAAARRYGLDRPGLVAFMAATAPHIGAFGQLLRLSLGDCPDFGRVLSAGAMELANLSAGPGGSLAGASAASRGGAAATRPPDFRPEYVLRLPESGCRVSNFEARRLLGRGAAAAVFLATDTTLGRDVALKVMLPPLLGSPTAKARFAREARVGAAIRHPNVAAVYAVGEAAGVPYLAMEYVAGETLEARLKAGGPLDPRSWTAAARQLAAGLAAAHGVGVVHRDVKPANVMVEAATGRVLLTDFGLAGVAGDGAVTAEGVVLGTPYFLAPEILLGRPATPQTDLFSLGGVLYLLAAGVLPFPGATIHEVSRAIAEVDPPPPSAVRPGVPAAAEQIIRRLLDKNPAARYATAAEVVAALA